LSFIKGGQKITQCSPNKAAFVDEAIWLASEEEAKEYYGLVPKKQAERIIY
jgi:hypothetical protein